MISFFKILKQSLFTKLLLTVGITLILGTSTWAYFNIRYQKQKLHTNLLATADRLSTTIRLGTHYAMMLNSRDDITQIIQNIGRQKDIKDIRIYNKEGKIKYSNERLEIDRTTNIKDEACYICHRSDPPVTRLDLPERVRVFSSPEGHRLLGIISPIYNDSGCSSNVCHVHPEDKKVLGALDVVFSLEKADQEMLEYEQGIIAFTGVVFLVIATIIFIVVQKFVHQPILQLIEGTRQIAKGDYESKVTVAQDDEMGQLAEAVNKMGAEIGEKQNELNAQIDLYQNLFEQVPCIVTVQDRDYRLIQYNREFSETFDPEPGEFCFKAYKGLDEKCPDCPVEKTFADGSSHTSEETGCYRDGTLAHWIVKTSPIRDARGHVVAAMEMCLDITPRKQLEEKLEQSEKKYHAIFNNIPNPVFVLDPESLEILDSNDSVRAVYGYDRQEITGRSFLDLFVEQESEVHRNQLKAGVTLNQIRHRHKDGQVVFVDLWIAPSAYTGKKVLLVTTSDISQRLETEQQLIHAGKMATLGEMATGVAHELNQPLTVIKTAGAFLVRRLQRENRAACDELSMVTEKIIKNIDRATKIINHMRDFARKSEVRLDRVQVNDALEKAFDMFSQQFKVRGIDVTWETADHLPDISADPDRLEQVFANLLVNARDAIEARTEQKEGEERRVTIRSFQKEGRVSVEICDTGVGIDPAVANKIFEPFFTTKEVGKGTGIGLSISYGIVKEFSGDIRHHPNPGGGACFVVSFPVRRAEPKEEG